MDVGTDAMDLVTIDSPLISGGTLLTEAAIAKLFFVLGLAKERNRDSKWVKKLMETPIRGDT